MTLAVAMAVAFALGVDLRRLALLAGAVYVPMAVGALIAVHWLRSRPEHTGSPALFCEGVASELRAGATLRDALATVATSAGSPSTSVGLSSSPSMAEVAAQVSKDFPPIAEELRLTIIAASRSGSDAAALFDEIGTLAIAQTEVRQEVRMATAPGRATALVLLGAPLVYVVGQLGSGGFGRLLESSEQRVVALMGLGLFVLGLASACLILWRASR
jgi:hypothetical protein